MIARLGGLPFEEPERNARDRICAARRPFAHEPLAELPSAKAILARLSANPITAEELAFDLDQYPHETDTLLREMQAAGLARRTANGWVAA